jgi:hypothetical protein
MLLELNQYVDENLENLKRLLDSGEMDVRGMAKQVTDVMGFQVTPHMLRDVLVHKGVSVVVPRDSAVELRKKLEAAELQNKELKQRIKELESQVAAATVE